MKIYSDGGCRGNGTAEAEMYGSFWVEGEAAPHGYVFGYGTNNEAEFRTLIMAMEYAQKNNLQRPEFVMDSYLLFNTIWGSWKVDAIHLIDLNEIARKLANQLKATACTIKGGEMKKILGH